MKWQHSRKGRIEGEIISDDGTWVKIKLSKPSYDRTGVVEAGEAITVRGITSDGEWFFGSTETVESAWVAVDRFSIGNGVWVIPVVPEALIPDTPPQINGEN